MKAIGGYFGLEIASREEYHNTAVRLNTGRNALAYALGRGGWTAVHLPYYTCAAVLSAVHGMGLRSTFHPVKEDLEIDLDPTSVGEGEVVLLTSYFGLKEPDEERWQAAGVDMLVDNCQAFFRLPEVGTRAFYSARKFFGVPDGAYLYLSEDQDLAPPLPQDDSSERFTHLLRRISRSPEDGYRNFQRHEAHLASLPVMRMSPLTGALLASIDYASVRQRRRDNFEQLHAALEPLNLMPVGTWYGKDSVPMIYPLLTDHERLGESLHSQRIYAARYWPNVLEWRPTGSFEQFLATHLVALPIDQRYSTAEMQRVIDAVKLSL